jgi:hypothetical protein
MPILEVIRRCIVQIAYAYCLLYLITLGAERLMPGFVAPFVDFAQAGIVAFVLAAVAMRFSDFGASPRSTVVSAAVLSVALLIAGTFAYLRIGDGGIKSIGLLLVACALAVLSVGTVLSKKE